MRKLLFVLSLMVLLSGCGGAGGSTTVVGRLRVDLSSAQGQLAVSETIHIAGAVSYTCDQSNNQNLNDSRCSVPQTGQGNTNVPLTFTALPTGQTYTFTDASTPTFRSGSCVITLVSTTETTPASGSQCTIDPSGPNPLTLTISVV